MPEFTPEDLRIVEKWLSQTIYLLRRAVAFELQASRLSAARRLEDQIDIFGSYLAVVSGEIEALNEAITREDIEKVEGNHS